MDDRGPQGLFASARRLSGDLVELGLLRLELFSTELQQEKLRVFEALAWLAAGVLAAGIGLLLLSVFVVLLFDERHRVAALGGVVLLYGVGAALALRAARARLREAQPFEASLAELRRDRAALSGRGTAAPPP